MQRIRDGRWHLADGAGTLRFSFVKTKKRLQRNFCVKKACEMLKHDPAGRGKAVEPNWKHAEKGKRTAKVNGEKAFVQSLSNMHGRFVSPFSHLHFE